MTGPEHYRKAEACAAQADRHLTEDPRDMEIAKVAMGIAQVHATLALFDGIREIGDQLDTLPRRRKTMPPLDPPPPGDFECCASGRCEICSPGYIWGRG